MVRVSFFPKNYTNISLNNNYFKYKKHIGFKIFKENLSLLEKKIKRLNERFKFRFYNEIDDKLLKKITNLNDEELKKSRSRMFSNPIFWEDSEKKIKKFEKEIKDCGFEMYLGGRFIHLSRSYDKGKAIQQFLKIITKKKIKNLLQYL